MNTKLLIPLLAVFLLAGCKEKSVTEKAVDNTRNAADKTSDAIHGGVKNVGESVEKAYDKTKDAVRDGVSTVKEGVKQGIEKTGDAFEKAGERLKEATK